MANKYFYRVFADNKLVLMLILLILAIVRTNYGLWNADIPLGDEGGYIGQSFALFEKGSLSANLYYDIYALLFRYVTEDPITAHYYVRFIASSLSVVGLFLLLSKLDEVYLFGAFVMALFWNLNLLNTPYVQRGNINLFTFALVCFSGYFWIAKLGRSARIFSLILLLAAIKIRPEYTLLLLFIALQYTALWVMNLKNYGWSRKSCLQLSILSAIIIFIATAFLLSGNIRNGAIRKFSELDKYLFLGLQQCYASFATSRDPSLRLEPMTEYGIIMDKQFPGASGFINAVMINPREAGRYFTLNGIQNLGEMYRSLLNYHSVFDPSESDDILLGVGKILGDHPKLGRYERNLTLFLLGFGNIWFLTRKLKLLAQLRIRIDDQAIFIVGLAAVALVPILIHLPDPRYWIMVVPLFYWGPAALISKYCVMRSDKVMFGLSVVISFCFISPVFTTKINSIANTDKEFVLALRDKISHINMIKYPINVIGIFPSPLLEFTIVGKWIDTNNFDVRNEGISYEDFIKTKEYDLVIIDEWLRNTQQYKSEFVFFDKFLQYPENFGYKQLMDVKKPEGPILIFCREYH